MNAKVLAKALGRRGGQARARNLSAHERRKIASLGGRAKTLSFHAEHRIEDNFRYLQAMEVLRKT